MSRPNSRANVKLPEGVSRRYGFLSAGTARRGAATRRGGPWNYGGKIFLARSVSEKEGGGRGEAER